MKLLAIDPAKSTGWAFGESTGRPFSGIWKLPGFSDLDRPRAMALIYSSVRSHVSANGIEGVVIEAPVVGIQRENKRGIKLPTSRHGELSLTMLSGAAQAGAINGGAKHIWMPFPNEWRKAVLGNGYPENPKAAALNYCRLTGCPVTEHDAAEAICLLQYGHGQVKLL